MPLVSLFINLKYPWWINIFKCICDLSTFFVCFCLINCWLTISILKYNRRSAAWLINGWMPRAGYLPGVGAPHLIVLTPAPLHPSPPAALPEANTSRNQLADTSINVHRRAAHLLGFIKRGTQAAQSVTLIKFFTDWCDVHDSLNQGVTGYLSADLIRPHLPLLLFLRWTVRWKMSVLIRPLLSLCCSQSHSSCWLV